MMTFEINTEDLKRLARKLDSVERDKALISGMNRAGLNIQRWIMEKRLHAAPGFNPIELHRISSRLSTSIARGLTKTTKTNDGYILKIGTNVEYASKHEFGIGVRPRPFMSAAIEDKKNQEETLSIITEALQKALDKE